MASTIPAIPDPGNDIASLKQTVLALKQAVEIFAGMRGNKATSAAATTADITTLKNQINNIAAVTSTFDTTITIDPLASSLNQGLVINQSAAGSINQNQYAFNSITISSDTVDNTAAIPFPLVDALLVSMTTGGSTVRGVRQAIEVDMFMTATSNASNPNPEYIGVEIISVAGANDNGTGGTPKGALFGLGAQSLLEPGATNWLNVTGAEFNTGVFTGASVAIKSGIQIAAAPNDAVQGSTIDAAIWLQAQNPTVGWQYGFLIGGTGSIPMNANGTLFGTTGNNGGTAVTNGIDISSYAYTGNAIHTPGFAVDSVGGITCPRVLTVPVTVSSLPSAATAGDGARAFVTDATATTFGSTVAGSGANKVPVYSDGTNWKIG